MQHKQDASILGWVLEKNGFNSSSHAACVVGSVGDKEVNI